MHVVILTLLRGVIEIGEGRRSRGDWYDLTDLWLERQEANQWIGATFNRPAGREAVLEVYNTAVSTVSVIYQSFPLLYGSELELEKLKCFSGRSGGMSCLPPLLSCNRLRLSCARVSLVNIQIGERTNC